MVADISEQKNASGCILTEETFRRAGLSEDRSQDFDVGRNVLGLSCLGKDPEAFRILKSRRLQMQ